MNSPKKIYVISTMTAGHLATLRVYEEDFDPNSNYEEIIYSDNKQTIVNIFNGIKKSLMPYIQTHNNIAWQKFLSVNPNTPIQR